ncbi:MAG: glucokinase, partial [Thermoanaerobaculia bacterium]|nr:glucokinase [Thermoanaerobaculia bacterium]
MNVMVGDIGGTNSRIAVVETGNDRFELLDERTYPSRDFPSLKEVLAEFVEEVPVAGSARRACFGIAGPVWDNRCDATNLPWVVDGDLLAQQLDLGEIRLLNDLEAGAWGLGQLGSDGLDTLKEGDSVRGNRALLAPGTGLGEAALFWDGHRHHPYATEGGHADFG